MAGIKTIEEIDAELEEKRKKAFEALEEEETEEEEETTEDVVEEESEEDEENAEEEDEVEEDEDEEEEVLAEESEEEEDFVTPLKNNKKDYAFKKLREEKEAAQAVTKEYEDMAIRLGYKNGAELLKAYKEKQIADEARSRNIDPDFYKEFSEMKDELSRTKQEKTKQEHQVKVDNFIKALDEVAEANSLTAQEKQDIVNQLGEDGYTMDDIVAIKAPKKLLRGYLSDKIAESKVQKNLKKLKVKKSLEEERISSEVVAEEDWKEEIRKDMEKYAKDNNLHFED